MVQAAAKKQKISTTPSQTTTKENSAMQRDEATNVKVGVIGCGRIGMLHLEALTNAPGITPVICANPTIERAEKGQPLCLLCRSPVLDTCISPNFYPFAFIYAYTQRRKSLIFPSMLPIRWMSLTIRMLLPSGYALLHLSTRNKLKHVLQLER